MTASLVSLLRVRLPRGWSGLHVLDAVVLGYNGVRYAAAGLGSVALVGSLPRFFGGPAWSAIDLGGWIGIAALTVILFALFTLLSTPLVFWAIVPMLRLCRGERAVLERALGDPDSFLAWAAGPVPLSQVRLLTHLCQHVSPRVVAGWSSAFCQQITQRHGGQLSLVRTFGTRLPPPVPGAPVPGLVAFALRSTDRDDREWAIRWLGTAARRGAS